MRTEQVSPARPFSKGCSFVEDQQFNRAHNRLRAVGERGNSILKMTVKVLRNVTLCPQKIGDIVAAALVIPLIEPDRIVAPSKPRIANSCRAASRMRWGGAGPFGVAGRSRP